ncbi:MAG: NUDIX hydrolase [Clostridia bacterium]|nr:NUDIX hydrolase [Clostridia bacterium]
MIEVVVGIVKKDERLLMVKRTKKEGDLVWTLPGGKIEENETGKQACAREVKEETGITISVISEIGGRIHPDTNVRITYFLCKYIEGETKVIDSEEIKEVAFKTKEEFKRDVTTDVFPGVLMVMNW